MARRVLRKQHKRALAAYLQGLARTRALENRIARRAAELERQLSGDAHRLQEAMRRETDRFRLRRLEAAYLYCVHRLAMMRRAQQLSRTTVQDVDRLLPDSVRR